MPPPNLKRKIRFKNEDAPPFAELQGVFSTRRGYRQPLSHQRRSTYWILVYMGSDATTSRRHRPHRNRISTLNQRQRLWVNLEAGNYVPVSSMRFRFCHHWYTLPTIPGFVHSFQCSGRLVPSQRAQLYNLCIAMFPSLVGVKVQQIS